MAILVMCGGEIMQASKTRSGGAVRGSGLGLYHFIWIFLALIASGYLAMIAFQPAIVAKFGATESYSRDASLMPRHDAQDVQKLARVVARVEDDLVAIKTEAAVQKQRTQDLGARVSVLETKVDNVKDDVKISQGTGRDVNLAGGAKRLALRGATGVEAGSDRVSGDRVGDNTGSGTVGRAAKRVVLSRLDAPEADDQSANAPQVINQAPGPVGAAEGPGNGGSIAANPIVTGSISSATPPPVPSRPTVTQRQDGATLVARRETEHVSTSTREEATKPEKTYGLAIARGSTLEDLRATWAALKVKHKVRLAGLEARYRLVVGQNGAPLRLIAGPVKGNAKAHRLCTDLAVLGTRCIKTTYSGNPL